MMQSPTSLGIEVKSKNWLEYTLKCFILLLDVIFIVHKSCRYFSQNLLTFHPSSIR